MTWVVVILVASFVLGGAASYSALQQDRPGLTYRPGTPDDIVENCRRATAAAAKAHASRVGAELVRVDATSAGPMHRAGRRHVAPVEVRVVYSRQNSLEARQSVVECRVNRRGLATLANLPGERQ